MASDNLKVPLVSASPSDDGVLSGHFQARGKASFLTAMLRTLSASSKALMYYGPGSLPHRIVEAVAMELSQLSFDVLRLGVRAVREAAYRAFQDDDLFPPRFAATYASGPVVVSPPIRPFTQDVLIQKGDLISTTGGATVVILEDAVLRAGQMSVVAHVRAEVPGLVGSIPAGALTVYVTNSNLRVTNPGPIDGGSDEESDSAIHERFRNYVLGIQTASGRSVLSAAKNAAADKITVAQVALVRPWRIPWMNREMGYGYAVLDAGSGSAHAALVEDAQRRVSLVTAAGEEITVVSCNPYAVSLSALVECRAGVTDLNLPSIRTGLQAAYRKAFLSTQIEDGSGQGGVRLLDIKSLLDAVPGVLKVTFPDDTETVLAVPVGARAVAGVLSADVYRGL